MRLYTSFPASRKRRRKGNPVVSDETVTYGYPRIWPLTLRYKLQIRPLVREGPQDEEQSNFPAKEREKKIWAWAPKECPTPRHTDCLAVNRKETSTSSSSSSSTSTSYTYFLYIRAA
jgi:hypothetical protein